MELSVKLKKQDKENPLRKHINFNVNQLRGDTQKPLINENITERAAIEELARKITTSQATTRAENNELWAKVGGRILKTQQITNFPPEAKTNKGEKGKTEEEIEGGGRN